MRSILLTICLFCAAATASERPNIIVIFTDDHGYADLGIQNLVDDIKTPHTDALARSGVVMSSGYSTAPQCIPSRGGLLTGRFQSRFGLEDNASELDGFNRETTIAKRLQEIGYTTAQFGKWHLGPNPEITNHGFTHVFAQNAQRPFVANIDLEGQDREIADLPPQMYHIDGCSRAAASIIERYHDSPFFLYIAYRAPHVPLDAPAKYLSRFPGEMPERRRQALAMISAMDDGVGLITDTLAKHKLTQKTLIFYIGDNGAPLKIHKADKPGGGPGWDGSLNDPLNGEKGMLTEGGIRVPFLVTWPGVISPGVTYAEPVTSLDVAATAAAVTGLEVEEHALDGADLIPYLTGEKKGTPHKFIAWRWSAQAAIREGDWKLLRGGDREYLYNLANDLAEKDDLLAVETERAEDLRKKLQSWTSDLDPPGLSIRPMPRRWHDYFDFYLDGKAAPPPPTLDLAPEFRNWEARYGNLFIQNGDLKIAAGRGPAPFLVRSKLNLEGPVTVRFRVKPMQSGDGFVAGRSSDEKDFGESNRVTYTVAEPGEWQSVALTLPSEGTLIHLRIGLPSGSSFVDSIELISGTGKSVSLWD